MEAAITPFNGSQQRVRTFDRAAKNSRRELNQRPSNAPPLEK
jgi:hypothetical protein